MEELKKFLIKLKDSLRSLINKLESSEIFERLVNKYETLAPNVQKRIRIAATLSFSLVLVWIFAKPILNTRSIISENRTFTALLSELKSFNTKIESSKKEYIAPSGWQSMQASNLNQLEDSLAALLASLGFENSQYELAPQGQTLLIYGKEATIKQLESFLFQVDGAFPNFTVVRQKTSVHPDNKELIKFEVEIASGDANEVISRNPIQRNETSNQTAPEDSQELEIIENQIETPQIEPRDNLSNNAPSYDPLEADNSDDERRRDERRDFVPSNRGGSNEFEPPLGEEFIPPPPPMPDEGGYMSDDEFPPEPVDILE